MRYLIITLISALAVLSCQSKKEDQELPYLGRMKVQNGDTLYHKIPAFSFRNQDSTIITNDSMRGKVYVADFFFTSCPDICPAMKTQMLRLYDEFKEQPDFLLVSHTIDPDYDTIALLRNYAKLLGVSSNTWHFLHGKKKEIYKVGQTGYMVSALEDKSAPGGYIHSGAFILVDQEGRIRGMYDGTKKEKVDLLIADIPKLLRP